MVKVKAKDLQQGDVIRVEHWSNLWKRVAPTTATVLAVSEFGSNRSILAKVRDGLDEFVSDIFADAEKEYEKIA